MNKVLILGIGNLLMGDEGVGIHIVRHIEKNYNLENVDIIDGGTGGFHLMEYFQTYNPVVLIDATIDGNAPGTINFLKPKFSSDYPKTLTAHDIGLKDLLDALYLLKAQPEIWLFTISISNMDTVTMELTNEIKEVIPIAAEKIVESLQSKSD
jgi:hydrogenase maturation protease